MVCNSMGMPNSAVLAATKFESDPGNSGNNDRTCKYDRHIYITPLSVCEDTAPAVRTKGWSDSAIVH